MGRLIRTGLGRAGEAHETCRRLRLRLFDVCAWDFLSGVVETCRLLKPRWVCVLERSDFPRDWLDVGDKFLLVGAYRVRMLKPILFASTIVVSND